MNHVCRTVIDRDEDGAPKKSCGKTVRGNSPEQTLGYMRAHLKVHPDGGLGPRPKSGVLAPAKRPTCRVRRQQLAPAKHRFPTDTEIRRAERLLEAGDRETIQRVVERQYEEMKSGVGVPTPTPTPKPVSLWNRIKSRFS